MDTKPRNPNILKMEQNGLETNLASTSTSCAKVHELPKSHGDDNWKGTLFS